MSENPHLKQTTETIVCHHLDDAVDNYTNNFGYRLEMLKPADSPREALLSKGGQLLRLITNEERSERSKGWVMGRAGMEYRDLIPDRLDGKVIGSHIRLTVEGEVPDYVHYHKVEFQMIRCIKGRIKVVYEDQAEPFWLEQGDWVIQPPEIRHRVLYAEAGSEVIEISMPAEHETWVDHEMQLPNGVINPDRDFNGQRFVRFVAPKS